MTRWLVAGDSHAEPLGDHLREQGWDVIHIEGHNGKGVKSFLEAGWLRRAINATQPDRVLIVLGGNDGWPVYEAETYAGWVGQLLQAVPNPIWVSPAFARVADVDARHARAQEILEGTLGEYGVPMFDSRPVTSQGPHAPDGVHFRPAGYARWAAAIREWELARQRKRGIAWALAGAGAALAAWGLWTFAGAGPRRLS